MDTLLATDVPNDINNDFWAQRWFEAESDDEALYLIIRWLFASCTDPALELDDDIICFIFMLLQEEGDPNDQLRHAFHTQEECHRFVSRGVKLRAEERARSVDIPVRIEQEDLSVTLNQRASSRLPRGRNCRRFNR